MICMNNYATPDPEKAEHINVPAAGEVQALWLVRTDPELYSRRQSVLYLLGVPPDKI